MICAECGGDVHNKDHHYVVLGDSSVLHLSCYEAQGPQVYVQTGGGCDKAAVDAYEGFWG